MAKEFKDGDALSALEWNEGLARAARHLVNDMGPCGTYGDANSDFLPDILKKYYAHDFSDLDYITLEHRPYGYTNPGTPATDAAAERFMEHWLNEECISKDILHTST